MDIRYSCNQKDFKRYTTEEMRDEMLITGLYKADEVVAVYSHVDRMVTLGCMPVHETVSIDKGIDVWANFGTHYFLERREIGMFNIGKDSTGIVVADGVKYELGYKDCLYITKGTKEVTFASADPEHPAKFYMVSAPAHCSYENKLITIEQADEYIRNAAEKRSRAGELKTSMGLGGRVLTPTERKYMTSWFDMGFDNEAILIAYDRTVTNTGALKWGYMNKIMLSWHDKGIHSAQDVAERDSRSPASAVKAENQHRSNVSGDELKRLRSIYEKVKNG